jgi:hypothetical protein
MIDVNNLPETAKVYTRLPSMEDSVDRAADTYSLRGTYKCMFQPVDKEEAARIMGVVTGSTQAIVVFGTDESVEIDAGDRVECVTGAFSGKTFFVHTVLNWGGSPVMPHVEVGVEEIPVV